MLLLLLWRKPNVQFKSTALQLPLRILPITLLGRWLWLWSILTSVSICVKVGSETRLWYHFRRSCNSLLFFTNAVPLGPYTSLAAVKGTKTLLISAYLEHRTDKKQVSEERNVLMLQYLNCCVYLFARWSVPNVEGCGWFYIRCPRMFRKDDSSLL